MPGAEGGAVAFKKEKWERVIGLCPGKPSDVIRAVTSGAVLHLPAALPCLWYTGSMRRVANSVWRPKDPPVTLYSYIPLPCPPRLAMQAGGPYMRKRDRSWASAAQFGFNFGQPYSFVI